jgi:predicted dehydrogenase
MPLSPGQGLPRVALIGVTGYGSIYLQLIREALQRREISLTAAVIINQDQVPAIVAELRSAGAVIYPNAAEFFAREAGRVDLCLVPTGIQWHARLTISALRAGMNVLVEKPLAGSVADADAVRAAERASKRWVAVGFQDIYSLETRWLKTQLLAGVIGELHSVSMIGLWPRSRAYFDRTAWAGRAAADDAAVLDSPLNNAFAHFVNLALFFAGGSQAESASATVESAELFRAHRIEMFDTAVVRARNPAGVRFWFGVSHAIDVTRQPEILLEGASGRIEWWHEQRCVVHHADGRRQVFPLPSTEDARVSMFEAMLARLRDPLAPVCTTAIAEKHTRLIEDVQRAGVIHEFPETRVDWTPDGENGSEIPVVRGLAEAFDQSFRERTRLADVFHSTESALLSP